ncbi:phosphoenolpyruvate-protein phosphotransferase, partial [Stenotrophomonas maltophilia]
MNPAPRSGPAAGG